MRPEGIGRFGSLMASTWRSYQSLTAWRVAQTRGTASTTPAAIIVHCPCGDWPEETTPQAKAHIGANQVIGFRSSTSALGAGVAIPGRYFLRPGVSSLYDTKGDYKNLHL